MEENKNYENDSINNFQDLIVYSRYDGKLDHFEIKSGDEKNSTIESIYPDKHGVLWLTASNILDITNKFNIIRKYYLTGIFKLYIDNDYTLLKKLVWGILTKKHGKRPSYSDIEYRKRHTLTVLDISREILNRYRENTNCSHLKNQLDFIFDNNIEWTVDMVAILHDTYKLAEGPLSHGRMAAVLFENICKDFGVNIHDDKVLFDMHTAISLHSTSELDITNIYYEIICDADTLSKWSTDYLWIQYEKVSKELNVSITEIYNDYLVSSEYKGYSPFYDDILREKTAKLVEKMNNKETLHDIMNGGGKYNA